MRRYFVILSLLFTLVAGCDRQERVATDVLPVDSRNPIVIEAYCAKTAFEVEGDLLDTKSTPIMVDFPDEGNFKFYKEPVSLFGFFLQDQSSDADSKGCFGETRVEVLENVALGTLSNQHAADILQETINDVAPTREYTQFMSNAQYVFSTHINTDYGGAYISNDIAAFWRPDAYHYLICYAPPLDDASLVEPLVVSLKTEVHGIQDNPDFNFLYGRRVLQYNDSKEHKPNVDEHPYHKTDGIQIKLMPMLSRISLHLKCSEDLKGSAVLFGVRVETFKSAKFHLDTGVWSLDDPDKYQTITRYYDNDYVIPTEWDSNNSFILSLFPNLLYPDDEIKVNQADPADNTPIVVRKLEVCINNTWIEVMNLEERQGDPLNPDPDDIKASEVVPLTPGYRTDIYLTVNPKKAEGVDDWNKLLVTFSNWKQDDEYEYEGMLE